MMERRTGAAGAAELARLAMALWPLQRGRHRLGAWMARRIDVWPAERDVAFPFGVLAGVDLRDPIEHYRNIFLTGEMDVENTAALKVFLREGDVVLDGGANSGYYTLVAARLIGPRGRCISFEPSPRIAARLQRSLELSRATNVDLRREALGAEPGVLELHLFADDPNGLLSSFAAQQAGRTVSEAVTCRVGRLDDLDPELLSRTAWLKLDVEGAELSALRGATRLLERAEPPVISFEYNVVTAESMGYHPTDVLELLSRSGYRHFLPALVRRRLAFQPLVGVLSPEQTPMVWSVPPGKIGDRLRPWMTAA